LFFFKNKKKQVGCSVWRKACLSQPCLTQTEGSVQEYSDLTASNRRPSHRTAATLPKAFHMERGRMLSRGRQNICRHLWHTFKIYQNLLGSEYLFYIATMVFLYLILKLFHKNYFHQNRIRSVTRVSNLSMEWPSSKSFVSPVRLCI